MKLKIIAVMVLPLLIVACFNKPASPEKNTTLPVSKQSSADFYRAALLNVEMGKTYLEQGQINRAKQKFVHALELKPKLPEAHSAIGYFYETVGDLEEAEKHHTQAISYGDGKARYYNNYGTFLCRRGRYKEADRAFNNALKDKQYIKTAEVYENAGLCALQAEDTQKAYMYLQTALQHDPSRSSASLELAAMELSRDNTLAAAEYLKMYKGATSDPTPRGLWIGIQTYKKLRRNDELASAVLQLKNMFPESVEYKAYKESKQE
jgi:type IV pilus assembly protein PilF